MIHELDPCQKLFNCSSERVFNKWVIKIGRLFQLVAKYPAALLMRANHNKLQRMITSYLTQRNPRLVISTIPLLNRAIACSCHKMKIKMMTVVTDFGCRPGFGWVYKNQTHTTLLPTTIAYDDAIRHKVNPQYLQLLDGLIVKKEYYSPLQALPTRVNDDNNPIKILVFMGALGNKKFFTIAQSLTKVKQSIEVTFVCGHNQELKEQLHLYKTPYRKNVVGFVNTLSYFQAADLFIGKPGPTCVTESLMMRTPVIVEKNYLTLEQENDVAQFVMDNQYGIMITNFKHCHVAIEKILQSNQFDILNQSISRYQNTGLAMATQKIHAMLSDA